MTGTVIWITGLSGAGKTTLAIELVQKLERLNIKPVRLDGDSLREILGKNCEDFAPKVQGVQRKFCCAQCCSIITPASTPNICFSA